MRLATWNVLCDAYLRPSLYPAVPPKWLEPHTRLPAVIRRALQLDADVLCLQEVDAHTAQALNTALGQHGYVGRWRQKSGGKPDGCAMFWRGLEAVDELTLVHSDGSGHVAQATVFRSIRVVTTHLKWSARGAPDRVTVSQAHALTAWLGESSAVPTLLCGDFNVTPDDEVMHVLVSAGFEDVFGGATTPQTCVANGRSSRIDHVVARGVVARPAAVQFDQQGRVSLPDADEPSDHVPLLVEW